MMILWTKLQMVSKGLLVRNNISILQKQYKKCPPFKDFLPTIKDKVTEVLKKVPEIKEVLSENVQSIPAKDDIKTRIAEVLAQFPEDDERITMTRKTLEENIDKIPENAEMVDVINMMAEMVPRDEEIHSGLDTIVDQ